MGSEIWAVSILVQKQHLTYHAEYLEKGPYLFHHGWTKELLSMEHMRMCHTCIVDLEMSDFDDLLLFKLKNIMTIPILQEDMDYGWQLLITHLASPNLPEM